ncbi:MAG: hypothetical protein JJ992_00190, partial [Planctomycetes bacterium]|nr:hypothetical protein [Planctomycetota bacterium]
MGTDRTKQLLEAILAVDPGNSRLRLELLDLTDALDDEPMIEILETLLDGDAAPVFVRGKGDYNRTQFRNYFDLAYRLMRLYQRREHLDRLQNLGLRIASGEKPFGAWWDRDLAADGGLQEVTSQ